MIGATALTIGTNHDGHASIILIVGAAPLAGICLGQQEAYATASQLIEAVGNTDLLDEQLTKARAEARRTALKQVRGHLIKAHRDALGSGQDPLVVVAQRDVLGEAIDRVSKLIGASDG